MERITDTLNKQVVIITRQALKGTITPECAVRRIRLAQSLAQDRRLQVVELSAADIFAASGL